MAANDPVDARGHTEAEAEIQEPLLDVTADPASETIPTGGEDVMVLAQSAAEVAAQIENAPGEES